MGRLRTLLLNNRRGLSLAVLLAGIAVVATVLQPHLPTDTDLELVLGPDHEDVVEVRLGFVQAGEELQGASFRFPEGAPARLRHTPRLPEGRYRLKVELRQRDGRVQRLIRKLEAPAQGLIRLRLQPGSSSTRHRRTGDEAGRSEAAPPPSALA